MKEEIICAGSGGQGVILLGKIIAQAALKENKHLTWFPSYGAAMRGGTAFSMVVISEQEIASAYIEKCDTLFVFNQPSWDKFKSKVKKGGLILLNSTLIKENKSLKNIKLRSLPFTEIAASLGNVRVANTVALGAYLQVKNILKYQTILDILAEIAPKDKQDLIAINQKALAKGYNSLKV